MAKYTNLNKALRKMIFERVGLCVLRQDDPRIEEYATELLTKKKSNIQAKELVRMYRHHCNKLTIALKYAKENNLSLKFAALDKNVCFKQLERYHAQTILRS